MSKNIQIDTKTLVRFWVILLVLFLAIFFIGRALTGLLLVSAALFLAIAIWPLVKKLNKTLGKKKDHLGISVGAVVGGVVIVLVFALMVIGPVVVTETSKFVSTAPDQIQKTISGWDGINSFGRIFGMDNAKEQIVSALKQMSSDFLASFPQTLFASIGTVANVLTGLIIVVVLTVLFLTQGPMLLESFWQKVGSRDSKNLSEYRRISGKLATVISRYVTGQVFVAIIDGVVAGLAVFVLSLIFGFSSGLAFPMGMIAMIFYLIPMFGPIITAIVVSTLLFFSAPFAGLSFLIFYIIFEQVENNVVSPRVQGNSMDLPPLIILIAVVIGMYMFGLIGAIISIPIAGCIKVLVSEFPNIKAIRSSVTENQ